MAASTAPRRPARALTGCDLQPVSDVRDRDYFRSIYYREPGGILFEIATATPGFAVDEPVETLGTELRVPKQFAAYRAEIERRLPPVTPPAPSVRVSA